MNVAIANNIHNCVLCTPGQFVITTTGVAGITPLTTAATHFRKAILMAKKDLTGTDNADIVALGPSAEANEQPIVLQPGDSYVLEAPLGAKWDFRDWNFLVAADNDGLVVIYS